MDKNQGIVLKSFLPQKGVILLLDRNWGKIESLKPSLPFFDTISPGIVLSYHAQKSYRHFYKITDIEVRHVPLSFARHDIYFLHYILTLCYYFLPFHSDAEQVYALMISLLESPGSVVNTIPSKKIFVLKFFLNAGMHPSGLPDDIDWRALRDEPIEIIEKKSDIIPESLLEHLLMSCIYEYAHSFRCEALLTGYKNAISKC